MALTDKLTAIADGFRTSRGTTEKLTLDDMAVLAGEAVGGSDVEEGTLIYEGTISSGDTITLSEPIVLGQKYKVNFKEDTFICYGFAATNKRGIGDYAYVAITSPVEMGFPFAVWTNTMTAVEANYMDYEDESVNLAIYKL